VADGVERRLELQEERADALAARVERMLAPFAGSERALDAGCGVGALAFALAPHVRTVVGIDLSQEFVDAARERAPANCTFVVGELTALPFEWGEFDLTGCARVLHHVRRPELVMSELARVTRPGGRILVVDQLASIDPVAAIEHDRFERARDPSHNRLLPDTDIRSLLDMNDLVVLENEIERERRDVDAYLTLAGVPDEERERLLRMAPAEVYDVEIGWYVARKRG
jgi:ubiquinone/menaquinone biosynthesis C-methylase UbiE